MPCSTTICSNFDRSGGRRQRRQIGEALGRVRESLVVWVPLRKIPFAKVASRSGLGLVVAAPDSPCTVTRVTIPKGSRQKEEQQCVFHDASLARSLRRR